MELDPETACIVPELVKLAPLTPSIAAFVRVIVPAVLDDDPPMPESDKFAPLIASVAFALLSVRVWAGSPVFNVTVYVPAVEIVAASVVNGIPLLQLVPTL